MSMKKRKGIFDYQESENGTNLSKKRDNATVNLHFVDDKCLVPQGTRNPIKHEELFLITNWECEYVSYWTEIKHRTNSKKKNHKRSRNKKVT